MKKISLILIIFVSIFLLTSCGYEEMTNHDEKAPTHLRKITGKIAKAKLDEEGNIIINENEITDEVSYISYEYEDVIIGLLTVRDSYGNPIVVVNNCQSCGGSPYAYFVQVGDKIQCQSCGGMFEIDELDNLITDGCNPIEIKDKTYKDGKIIIGTQQFKELKGIFENWKGPKE